jgi:hypothetical protein
MKLRFQAQFVAVVAGATLITAPVQAQVGYDDILGTAAAAVDLGVYGGFTYTNFAAIDGCNYSNALVQASGYCNGVVSPNNTIRNGFGDPASITSGMSFVFGGAWFTGAWNDGLMVTITGWNGGGQLYGDTFATSAYSPTFFLANWGGIDELRFSAAGGIDQGFGGQGTHFVMDDVYFNRLAAPPGGDVVPEPATMTLLATGLAGMAAARRRKQSSV